MLARRWQLQRIHVQLGTQTFTRWLYYTHRGNGDDGQKNAAHNVVVWVRQRVHFFSLEMVEIVCRCVIGWICEAPQPPMQATTQQQQP